MSESNTLKAFLTGSRVYGTPKEDSDIDLVIYMDEEEKKRLFKEAGGLLGGRPVRFANLNLIIETDNIRYKAWEKGTKILKKLHDLGVPVTRDQAVDLFKSLRVGSGKSGGDE